MLVGSNMGGYFEGPWRLLGGAFLKTNVVRCVVLGGLGGAGWCWVVLGSAARYWAAVLIGGVGWCRVNWVAFVGYWVTFTITFIA